MKTRPRKLTCLAYFLFLVALSLPIQIMIMYEHSPFEVSAIAAKLAPLNWVILVLSPLVAYLMLRASRLVILMAPVLVAVVIYNNWLVGKISTDYSLLVATTSSLGFVILLAMLWGREVRELILHPERRWWLIPRRKRTSIMVRIKVLTNSTGKNTVHGKREFYQRLFNLSEGGAFVPFHYEAQLRTLTPGTKCYVSVPMPGFTYMQCRAEVVRNTPPRGQYPSGIGIKFLGLNWQEKKNIRSFVEHGQAA